MYAPPAALPAGWAERRGLAWARVLPSRALTFCWLELRKIRHDQTELATRAVQPALWLLVFGETFTRLRAIPTGGRSYLDYMAPGVIAQSALFIAIFYGVQLIWERDFGILTRLMATPTPNAALVAGKAFGAAVRAIAQALVVLVLAVILRVGLDWNPLHILLAVVAVVLGSVFFSTLSMTIAGLVISRERLMGIGQAITMPLFFASNALYPVKLMPGWLQALSAVNPLSYEVDALRTLLVGIPSGSLWVDFLVLAAAAVAGVVTASRLLNRLAA